MIAYVLQITFQHLLWLSIYCMMFTLAPTVCMEIDVKDLTVRFIKSAKFPSFLQKILILHLDK